MNRSAITPPRIDPTPIFEHFRGNNASELLTIAVAHFDIFGRLSRKRLSLSDLRRELRLEKRPAIGGLFPLAGDPSPGIVLLPIGAVLLLVAAALTAP